MSRALQIITIVAVAVAAFAVADIAHETIGHGGMCALLGGKVIYVSSTFEDCSVRSWIIDGAGPSAGIVAAIFFWLWARFLPPRNTATHAFLAFTFAFAAFWNFGYLIKSGLTDQGDWAFVIAGLQPSGLWHAGLTIAGVALYALSTRLFMDLLVRNAASDGVTPLGFALTGYVAAAALATLAASFDPRGPGTILDDALPASLAALGMPWGAWRLQRRSPELRVAVRTSPAWIAAGAIIAGAFVGLLGPGLRF